MRIPRVGPATAEQLQSFVDPVYLHQVVERGPDGLVRYTDLPDALANLEPAVGREWRIHFHVPIFLEEMAEVGTTQSFLRDILAIQRDTPVTNQLEVETYTWDVLPGVARGPGDLVDGLEREYEHVISRLRAAGWSTSDDAPGAA